MSRFEIEIKSLLGGKENAENLRQQLMQLPNPAQFLGRHSQLNHYFSEGEGEKLLMHTKDYFSGEQLESLHRIFLEGKDHSVRTRQADGDIRLVVKASIDDTTSANGISRMEFDEKVEGLTLDELDQILLESDFNYQAKWSRDREEYKVGDITVSLDRNAGYGYVAEFEKIVENSEYANDAREELLRFMKSLGIEELPQDRLERMFAYYNEHWSEYYGTDQIFIIE